MNRMNPPVYDTVDHGMRHYQCPPGLAPDNIPGAFKPPTTPAGLWSRKCAIFPTDEGNFFFNTK